jgi:hypothetical protein
MEEEKARSELFVLYDLLLMVFNLHNLDSHTQMVVSNWGVHQNPRKFMSPTTVPDTAIDFGTQITLDEGTCTTEVWQREHRAKWDRCEDIA